MTRITGDDFMLMGLHKMAAELGDGYIPEMMDVLMRSRRGLDERGDLLQFPEGSDGRATSRVGASNENNVIAFPLARRRVVRR